MPIPVKTIIVIYAAASLFSCNSTISSNSTNELVNGVPNDILQQCVQLQQDMIQAIRSNQSDSTRNISRERRNLNCDDPAIRFAIALSELDGSTTQEMRFYMLRSAAKTAFDAGQVEQAELFANELLQLSESYPGNWNFGNAIHDGNMVLGRIALANEQLEEAKNYLMLAAQTPGSPQLNSFGPNLSLAHDLLTVGETEIVVEYLELCTEFWNANPVLSDVESWIVLIRGGIIPKFGANLLN